MEFIKNLEAWDFLALLVGAISVWLLASGIKKLHAANPEQVDAGKLKVRAYGALIAVLAYLACKKFGA